MYLLVVLLAAASLSQPSVSGDHFNKNGMFIADYDEKCHYMHRAEIPSNSVGLWFLYVKERYFFSA